MYVGRLKPLLSLASPYVAYSVFPSLALLLVVLLRGYGLHMLVVYDAEKAS